MNERRRFLQVVGGSVAGVAAGCAAPQPAGTGTQGSGGAGTGGSPGTGGAASGSVASNGSTGSTVSSSSGGNCGVGGAANQGANNDFCQSNKGRFDVGKPADYVMGFNKVTNTNASILMVRDADGLYALSSWCPHECCDMNDTSPQGPYGSPTTVNGKAAYRCNCHGSKFYADGTVAKGPASQGLAAYELSLGCDGILYVDTGKTVPSTTRLMA
jgi:Rieske Fe-S protein